MNAQDIKRASEATIRRLPAYHRFLTQLRERGREVVSCTHISSELRLDSTQVRKDLAATGIVGKPKVGYRVAELMRSIEGFLGWNNVREAFLVGVGHLGTALLGYQGFGAYGLDIVAGFDSDPGKVDKPVHGKMVFPLDKLPDLVERMHIKIGIIATPAGAAQSVATLMVLSGILAIWNFTPVKLDVPPEIIVENMELSTSLAVLSNKLARRLASSEIVQETLP